MRNPSSGHFFHIISPELIILNLKKIVLFLQKWNSFIVLCHHLRTSRHHQFEVLLSDFQFRHDCFLIIVPMGVGFCFLVCTIEFVGETTLACFVGLVGVFKRSLVHGIVVYVSWCQVLGCPWFWLSLSVDFELLLPAWKGIFVLGWYSNFFQWKLFSVDGLLFTGPCCFLGFVVGWDDVVWWMFRETLIFLFMKWEISILWFAWQRGNLRCFTFVSMSFMIRDCKFFIVFGTVVVFDEIFWVRLR